MDNENKTVNGRDFSQYKISENYSPQSQIIFMAFEAGAKVNGLVPPGSEASND